MSRRRPAAAPPGLRRPSRHRALAVPLAADPISVSEAFHSGQEVEAVDCPLSLLEPGTWFRGLRASYEGGEVDFAGKVKHIQVEGLSWEVIVSPTGTKSEDLLRYCTSVDKPVLRCHLCRRDCDRRRTSPELLHLLKLQKISPGEDLGWENNLCVEDELPTLREAHQGWKEDTKGTDDKKEAASSSSTEKRKRKKKLKKKQKKKDREKYANLGGKQNSVKPLTALFSGTGLDPEAERRKILRRRVKKRLKKSKDSSSSTGSSTSEEGEGPLELSLLEQRSKIQRISEAAPGLLASEALQVMKQYLLQANGTPWGVEDATLPPLVLQYVRQVCQQKATPPVLREMSTLATLSDQLLLGRPAEALDIALQRLKSLEMSTQGHTWMTAQRVELLPRTDMGLAGRGEVQVAQRETALDVKAKGSSNNNEKGAKGKGSSKGKEREKGKSKGKGGSKEEGKKNA